MVKLKNTLRQLVTFNLETVPGENGMPGVATFMPLETKELPEAALESVEIANALKRRKGNKPATLVQL